MTMNHDTNRTHGRLRPSCYTGSLERKQTGAVLPKSRLTLSCVDDSRVPDECVCLSHTGTGLPGTSGTGLPPVPLSHSTPRCLSYLPSPRPVSGGLSLGTTKLKLNRNYRYGQTKPFEPPVPVRLKLRHFSHSWAKTYIYDMRGAYGNYYLQRTTLVTTLFTTRFAMWKLLFTEHVEIIIYRGPHLSRPSLPHALPHAFFHNNCGQRSPLLRQLLNPKP
jgi:hypothetical protein